MPSKGNYPFQAIIGGAEIWIYTEARTTPDTLLAGNRLANGFIGYIPDPRATGVLFQMQNQDIAGSGYGFKIDTSEAGYFTVKIIQISDGTVIDTAKLNDTVLSDSITWSKINFWITVDNTENTPKIGKCGIGGEYIGTFPQTPEGGLIPVDMPIDNYSFVEFTGAGTAAIINQWCEIRELSNFYGSTSLQLNESDGFIVTELPAEVFSKNVYSGNDYNECVIPLNDDFEDPFKNIGLIGWTQGTGTFMGWCSDAIGSPQAMGLALVDYYPGIGSDILRKTSDGKYYNGIDMLADTLAYTAGTEADPYLIPFSGGSIAIYYKNTYGTSGHYVVIKDSEGNNIGTPFNLPCLRAPGEGIYASGGEGLWNVYLCKNGSDYYLMGLWAEKPMYKGGVLVQSTSTDFYGNHWNNSVFYQLLYKFDSASAAVLESASEVVTEYDPTNIDENSPEASTGDNAEDGYDRTTNWSSGPEAGTNNGIRHNGEENIDASDLEETRADQYEGIKQPDESGENKIPTPLNTGMIKAFAPSPEELEKFGMDLNSDSFASTIRNYFNNPMDVIISCHTCIAPSLSAGAECYLTYGNWTSQSAATPYSMHVLDQMYYRVPYGELNLSEITNDWRFYERQKLAIYLPWIGVRDIDPKLLNGKLLKLYYNINVLTGDILAELKAQNENTGHLDTYYVWSGNTLSQMPLKSTDYSAMLSGAISTTLSTVTAMGGALAGNPLSMFGAINALQRQPVHPDIKLQGTFTGGTCAFMTSKPMILRQYPYGLNKKPYLYDRLKGLPGNIGTNILNSYNSLSGTFIRLEAMDLSNIYTAHNTQASEAEKLELERLLKTGVYV